MRALIRCGFALGFILSLWAAPVGPAAAASLDTTADRVLGQAGFTTSAANNNSGRIAGLDTPYGALVDPHTGRLWVSDTGNNRVLSWPNAPAFSNGQAPDIVLGQPDFSSHGINTNGLSASSLAGPIGLAVDQTGDLYVADSFNNRVLRYTAPVTTHAAAVAVLGQPNFLTNTADFDGGSEHSLFIPTGLAVDYDNNLVVADKLNNRVLFYWAPAFTGDAAWGVFGQPDFHTITANTGGLSDHSLFQPFGVAVDGQRDVAIADQFNHRVLLLHDPVNTGYTATVVLGQPSFITNSANTGGVVNASGLNLLGGVGLDASGDLFVSDANNNRVLEYAAPLTTGQAASQFFGQPDIHSNAPNDGGSPSAATLNSPELLALDLAGNLYVPDVSNNRLLEYDQPVPYQAPALRRLSPATLAAGAPAFTLAVNGNGFVPSSVVRWQGSPRPTTFINSTQLQAPISAADVAGGGPFDVTGYTPGGGASASLNLTLYARHSQDAIADVVFGQPSFVTSTLNNPDLAGGANWMNGPTGVAVDVRTGRLFVSDPGNSRVLSWASAAAQANGQAADLVIGQPDLYHYGYAFTATGLAGPEGLAVDLNGNLYVVDGSLNRVTEYDAPLTTGMAATRVFGQGGSFTAHDSNHGGMGPDSLYLPVGVAVDAQGNMYVADSYNDRVLEYDAPLAPGGDTTADRVFGEPNFYTDTAPAPITSAITLYRPEAVAVGAQGQLFVADTVDSRVLEYVSPLTSRVADRVLGQPGFSSIDPPFIPDASSLNDPQGLTVDLQGNLYVGDSGNNRVLEYDAPLTTHAAAARVFGQPSFITDTANAGGLSALSLSNPNQLALDAHGDLFVADWQNSRVLEYDRPLPLLAVFLPLVRR